VRDVPDPPPGTMLVDGVAVRHGTHLCGLYDTDAGRIRQAAEFLVGGCRPGAVGILVATPEDRERTSRHWSTPIPWPGRTSRRGG
jgi:hypothetical protein